MDFSLSEDRRMLSDTLRRFLAERCDMAHRNAHAYTAPYHDPETWRALAELGVLGALVDEAQGGFGGAGFDIAVVFEELGRALSPEPVLGALLAARLLGAAGEVPEALLDGSHLWAAALGEIESPYDLAEISASGRAVEGGHVLSGRKSAVYGGQAAARFVVLAGLDGAPALFEVEAGAAEVVPYGMIDGGGAAELLLDDTPARLLMRDAGAAAEAAVNAGIVALAAEAVGLMETAHAQLLDYMRTRKQFGVAIGKFQVLQHRAVDMLCEIEQARSITIKAASELEGPQAGRFASMAKAHIGTTARLVAEEVIQMHGGIAMTWEHPASHQAKRLVMIDAQLGDTDHHLNRLIGALQAS